MSISHNDFSNEALWGLYSRLTQQARQLEYALASPRDRSNSITPWHLPFQRPDPTTPIQPTPDRSRNDSDEENVDTSNKPLTPYLTPNQRQVTLIFDSSPAARVDTPTGQKSTLYDITIGSSSDLTQTPHEQRVPVQTSSTFPIDLRDFSAIRTRRAEVLEIIGEGEAQQQRIVVKRAIVDAYRQLIDSYFGLIYNINTDYSPSPDSSDPRIPKQEPIDEDVLSLVTAKAYVNAGVVESAAYDISDLGLGTRGNYYLGRFDYAGEGQENRTKFPQRTWADLIAKVDAFGESYDTAYPKVCNHLRTRRKLVIFANINRHATVLTLVRRTRTATFFDTMSTTKNDSIIQPMILTLCSSVIRSVFNEAAEGWTMEFAGVERQSDHGNNCGMHSLLRIRDELEDNRDYDTSERSANTLRIYLALRLARGRNWYPLSDIINDWN